MNQLKTYLSIILFMVFLICFTSCTEEVAGPEPKTYKIAFVMNYLDNEDIYTINPDGTELIQLTNSADDEYNPIWSHDGQWIYYQSDRNIYKMRPDGSGKEDLTMTAFNDVLKALSPDGTKIAFATDRVPNTNNICVLDLLNSLVTPVTSGWNDPFGNVDFMHDGLRLMISIIVTSPYHIYVYYLDGSSHTLLLGDDNNNYWPVLSPDGSMVTYVCKRSGIEFTDIWVCNNDGSGKVNVSNSSLDNYRPCWSPDGQKIAFTESIDIDKSVIKSANIDGSDLVEISDNETYNSEPAWSPDGSNIAFVSTRDGHKEIYIVNSDGSNETRLTNSAGNADNPVWSPAL